MANPSIEQLDAWAANPKIRAFLNLIAWAEGTTAKGYKDYYAHALTLDTSKPHPRIVIRKSGWIPSSAAGRYQAMPVTWDAFVKAYITLAVMSPTNQDRFAVWRLYKRASIQPILDGNIELALHGGDPTAGLKKGAYKGASYEWASFPPTRYGQAKLKMADVLAQYNKLLGKPSVIVKAHGAGKVTVEAPKAAPSVPDAATLSIGGLAIVGLIALAVTSD